MKRIILTEKPDHILVSVLLLQLAGGWIAALDEPVTVYLLIATGLIPAAAILCVFGRNRWELLLRYRRFFILLGMLFTVRHWWSIESFSPPLVTLHTISILVLSALYLKPWIIWAVVVGFALFALGLEDPGTLFMDHSVYGWIAAASSLMTVCGLHLICLIFREDVTRVREVEHEHNIERMSRQQHLATIGQIAASIAHDIRNPLTSIKGFVQLMEKNGSGRNREYFQIIQSEIARIDNLLREVLQLSKSHTVDTASWTQVKLDELLQRLAVLLEPEAIQGNVEIRLAASDPVSVSGSEEKLQQVFLNLLRNALEAMQADGVVDIVLSEEEGMAIVRIRDTGPGIPEERMDYLFTPFYTTKTSGTGLGLSICQSIIKDHDGTIQVRNMPEQGAEFTIALPLARKIGP